MTKFPVAVFSLSLLILACAQQKKVLIQQREVAQTSSDSALLDSIEKRTFDFFWNGAEPNSGMAPERIHTDGDYPANDRRVIATGGSGFGVMAILAGIHRGFITRTEGVQRFEKIISFFEKA